MNKDNDYKQIQITCARQKITTLISLPTYKITFASERFMNRITHTHTHLLYGKLYVQILTSAIQKIMFAK